MRGPVLLTMAIIAGAADLKIDHVTVAGTNLKEMQAHLAAVGIASEYGGAHSNGATEMALTSFPDGSYLELIAMVAKPDQKALDAHYWSKQMRGNAGPAAWAVRAADVSAEAARLRTAGVTVGSPNRSGRARPDGVRLDWETAQVGPEPNGTFFPFLIRDFTPREARAFPKGQPTNTQYAGVKRVVIAVRDLKASIARYRQAFGWAEPVEEKDSRLGARLELFEGTPVALAVPLDSGSWLQERMEQFGEGPCAFVLQAPETHHWSGEKRRWLDAQMLGWHLGMEH
jgi:hypothetical protein